MKRVSFLVVLAAIQCGLSCSLRAEETPSGKVKFEDVTESAGIITIPSWKYGGPTIADLNNDGRYELLLGNHDRTPVQLFWANGDNTYTEQKGVHGRMDLHGMCAGDYDMDGDNDIMLSRGGGNGLHPQPPYLLRNDGGTFVDVTKEAGLSEMGCRGRSVRWIDLDSDGDLDLLQINAAQMVEETGPRNILFENNGDATFTYHSSPAFEQIDAERLLVTDFNNDHVPDLVTFSPYSPMELWQGNDDFTFTNVSTNLLPESQMEMRFVSAVAEADIDNDGDLDLYFSRGNTLYQIANNSISFDECGCRLDLRDEGNKSHDGISFEAEGSVELLDFWHFPRGKKMESMPVFLGENKEQIATPSNSVMVTQEQAAGFPDALDKTGWYLGHLGCTQWRFEWMLADNLAWDVRASIKGVKSVQPDWEPQNLDVPDVLLRNDGDRFTDISSVLPEECQHNNWGVITGDFNNDGYNDFFVHRFGELKRNIDDLLLINDGKGGFTGTIEHGANEEVGLDSHGDMGSAFDYDLDGRIDMLNGDDDNGRWHLYRNTTPADKSGHLLVRVGYSERGVDAIGAEITVTTDDGSQFKRIGSGSESHAQSLLNTAHFGLGASTAVRKVEVRWRDGATERLVDVEVNQLLTVGNLAGPVSKAK